MSGQAHHISVCICTYRRPQLLRRLLESLRDQDTGGLFTYSIVVSDNDCSRSAEPLVAKFAASAPVPSCYCSEPRRNISLARNKAIENAHGDFIAFIDDDEFAPRRWLLTLFEACKKYDVDGVLGPVRPHFDEEPPPWVRKGRFCDRPSYPTGFVIDWTKGRTGNTLLRKGVFPPGEPAFSPEFHRAGDQDFFRRMIERGHTFVWCDEAVAYEAIPPLRWKRSFMLKRALLRGKITLQHPTFGMRDIAKSLIAVPAYTAALPLALVLGQHRFMDLLVRLFDHLGKLLALVGMNPVRSPYAAD